MTYVILGTQCYNVNWDYILNTLLQLWEQVIVSINCYITVRTEVIVGSQCPLIIMTLDTSVAFVIPFK